MTVLEKHSPKLFAGVLLALVGAQLGSAQNPIQKENSNPGTSGWQLSNPAVNREIEGYASLTSVNIGGNINFSVSTTDSTFHIDIFRTGWYGGVGARLLQSVSNLTGVHRNTPSPDSNGMVECNWASSYTLTVPTTWVSGMYLARLTGDQSGKQSWIIFVVRDDNRGSDLLFESSVTTFQAYNFWPGGANGKSLYDFAPGGRAWKVSFNRPYVLGLSYDSSQTGAGTGIGAGEFLTNVQPSFDQGYPITAAGFEYNMVRWLEKSGYDVTYLTDIDVHENANLMNNHTALLSVGHNEYWSMQMRQNIQNAVANGMNFGDFSSNTLYWQIRLETSPKTGAADRTEVCYKYDAPTNDPQYNTNLATVRWRDPAVNMPEGAFIGVEYFGDPVTTDLIVNNATHWLWNGTGVKNGDHIAGIIGYEASGGDDNPSNIQYVNDTPVGPFNSDYDNPPGLSCNVNQCNDDVTWYSTGNSFVFAASSMMWSWGLDDYNGPATTGIRSNYSSSVAQQFTANVLTALTQGVKVTTTSLPAGTKGQAYGPVQLTASGGGLPANGQYIWTATGLPSGITLSSSGVLSGTPSVAGTFNVTFTATDDAHNSGSATLTLTINSGVVTYSISGQITSSGSGLTGVTVTLNTGATATTNISGNYTISGLSNGTYTVTPSLSGYVFTPTSQNATINNANATGVNFTASKSTATAKVVSINFGADQPNGLLNSTDTAGVVPKANWNNASGNVSSSALALFDETGTANGATVTWTSDNTWAVPISGSTPNIKMMTGYLDTGNQNNTIVTVSGLPASSTGYDIYVYTDGDNGGDSFTGTYQISGNGINTTSITATDPANTNFSGTFTQAVNSNGNYVKFTAIKATGFTITAIPTSSSTNYLRAPLNGIQIVPTPTTTTARGVSINFGADQLSMVASESAGVVAKTNWNNASGNTGTSLALVDETGALNGATVTWTSDNTWKLPISGSTANIHMMTGYLDTGKQNNTTVTVANLPTSSTGYDIYVYTDGDNATASRTGTYQISGTNITTTNVNATDAANKNFSGTFTQANNSNGNYVKFSSISATAFTIKAIPSTSSDGTKRAPLNGIQIIPH